MDDFDELPTYVDIVYSWHLTLAVFPMYIAIGQIFFEKNQIGLIIRLEKCVCWRQLHNVLETKCTNSGGKSQFSL